MCSIVFMSNTVYVPVRMPQELVEAIDIRAVRENRKRSQVIVMVLGEVFGVGTKNDAVRGSGGDASGSPKRSRDRASLPVLQATAGESVNVHQVQSVRSELAGRGNAPAGLLESRPPRSPSEKCPHGNRNAAYCRAIGGEC